MTGRCSLLLIAILAAVISGCGKGAPPLPSGTFEATEIDLSPRVAGQFLRVAAAEGDRVSAGDTLLVTDTALLRLQRAETQTTAAGIAAQRRVALDRRDQARRREELAATTLQRLATMQKAGNATAQQLDEAQTASDVARAEVSAAKNAIDALEAEAARLQARLAVLDRQISDGVLLAPADGTILLRTAEPGEMGTPGAVALRLADLSRLELRIYLEETDLDLVGIGRRLPVHVDALPNRTLEGVVTWISDEAEFTPKNAQTRDTRAQLVYAVKLAVDNPDGLLHIGMPAEADPGR